MPDLQNQLKNIMAPKNITAYCLSMETDVNEGQLSRFFSRASSISIKMIQTILDYLGCELVVSPKSAATCRLLWN